MILLIALLSQPELAGFKPMCPVFPCLLADAGIAFLGGLVGGYFGTGSDSTSNPGTPQPS